MTAKHSLLPSLLVGAFLLQPAQWLKGVRADPACVPSAARMGDTVGSDTRRLHSDLLCDYDRLVVQPGTGVEVSIYIYRLHLDVHRGFLQMLVDMSWKWYDPRLRWDPSQYSDVQDVVLSDKEIWIPDLEALNSMQRDWDDNSPLRCLVTSAGNVTCNPVFNLQTTCGSSVRHWPLDQHECVFELASRNHDSREYRLFTADLNTTEVATSEQVSHEWEVTGATQIYEDAYISANFHFTRLEVRLSLRRNKYIHVLTVGVPMIGIHYNKYDCLFLLVLPCLVLAQLWLDPRWPARLTLGCSVVASLCLYLQYLSDTVPDDTEGQAPLIILFYRDSLVLATAAVLLGVTLRGLAVRSDAPPPWLTGSSSWLLRRVPRPLAGALLEEDEEDEDAEPAAEAAEAAEAEERPDGVRAASWLRIARLADRILFVVFSVTFAVLMAAESP